MPSTNLVTLGQFSPRWASSDLILNRVTNSAYLMKLL